MLAHTSPHKIILLGTLFIISVCSLAIEVALTRLFSFLFVQSYVYIIISFCMAGIGTGAVVLHFVRRKARELYFALITIAPLALTIFMLLVSTKSVSPIVCLSVIFALFLTIGSNMVLIFQHPQLTIPFLYGSDLLGAAIGSVACFFLLNWIGAPKTLLGLALLLTIAYISINLTLFQRKRYYVLAASFLTLGGVLALTLKIGSNLHPQSTRMKEMTVMLQEGKENPRIIETRWSAFGRTDLVESDNPLFKTMFIDGGAGTKMIQMQEGHIDDALAYNLRFGYMGGLPVLAIPEEKRTEAAVIGSGGGIDVVTLLLWGYKSVTAVEINPDFIELVKEWREYNGGIYTDEPRVHLVKGEGRSYLRNSGRKYALILMSLPITKSVRSYANQELVENYLFTFDAFSEYRRTLEEGGYLIVVAHYPNELLRLVANAVKSFQEEEISADEAMKHIACVGPDTSPTLIIKNGRFEENEVYSFLAILERFKQNGSTNFVPFLGQKMVRNINQATGDTSLVPEFHPLLFALSRREVDLNAFSTFSNENVGWISDNSPFFYQFSRSLPKELITVLAIAFVLLLSACTALWVTLRTTRMKPIRPMISYFALFAMLGLAFILIELATLQKFIPFWEHQTLALNIVLALILAFSGTGGLLSQLIRSTRMVALCLAVAIIISVLTAYYGTRLLSLNSGFTIGAKLLVTIAGVGPLFFFLGIPFPWLLRILSTNQPDRMLFPWLMGVNSIMTLGGGAVSMAIAIGHGFRLVLLLGAGCYLVCILLIMLANPEESVS